MAVVHLFCTVVLVGIGQNWGDCNIVQHSENEAGLQGSHMQVSELEEEPVWPVLPSKKRSTHAEPSQCALRCGKTIRSDANSAGSSADNGAAGPGAAAPT